jgi:hypothetical protein
MKLIIAGSRTFDSFNYTFITNLVDFYNLKPTTIVCGCGGTDETLVESKLQKDDVVSNQGVDLLGEIWAKVKGIEIAYFPGGWKCLGRKAGPIRNKEMAVYGDALLLIWDGKSRGSALMKKEMELLKKPVYEVILNGERK